jgi:hypothetical protein
VGRLDVSDRRDARRRVLLTPKCFGNPRPIEVVVSTFATDRALLFLGVPGTAKNRVS